MMLILLVLLSLLNEIDDKLIFVMSDDNTIIENIFSTYELNM